MERSEKQTVLLTAEEKQLILNAIRSWMNEYAELNCEVTLHPISEKLVLKGVLEGIKKDFNVLGNCTIVFPFAVSYTALGTEVQQKASLLLRRISSFIEAKENQDLLALNSATTKSLETISYPYLFNVLRDGSETIQAVYQLTYRKGSELII